MKNQDLLDLCKLNLMEEHIGNVTETGVASTSEVANFKDAIKMSKRRVANRIINTQKPASEEVLKRNEVFQAESEQLGGE